MQRNNSSLFRRLAAAAVGVATMMSLTACAINPAEIFKSFIGKEEATHPQELSKPPVIETLPETLPYDSEETIPPQPTQTTNPKIEVDYEHLVSDAFMDSFVDPYGYECCYHIPQFNLSAEPVQKVNSRIFDQYYNILQWDIYPSIQEYNYTEVLQIVYNWGYQEKYVSVVVHQTTDWSASFYDVFTVSIETGREASEDEILAEFGLDREEFYDLVRDRLKQYWDERNEFRTASGADFFDDRVRRTLADSNVRSAIPYINPQGELSFVVEIYSLAGADSYQNLINAKGTLMADSPECTQYHSSDSYISMDDPLEYFIENCNRMYFTNADIQSFDEEMCLYARNAIYAKSGWTFSSANLWNFFNRYSWYHPTVTADEFSEDMLNAYQIANRDLIVKYENALKGENLDDLQYFIENCDSRYFTAAEISGFDAEELVYARNAIYAKSGRIFNMEKLIDYFQKYSWYMPYIPADEFTEDMLNQYQTANRDLILAREEELSSTSP